MSEYWQRVVVQEKKQTNGFAKSHKQSKKVIKNQSKKIINHKIFIIFAKN